MHNLKLLTILKVNYSRFTTTCTVNRVSVNVSVLPSIAPLSPALFLYRYYVLLCPSV
jgi:hypothetical protein